jgi:hypothetical protein
MRKTLYPKTSLQVIIPLACSISAAMMLEVFLFTTKRTKDTKNGQPDFNMLFSSFVLFVFFVVVYFG